MELWSVAAQERIVLPLFPDGGGTLKRKKAFQKAALLKIDVQESLSSGHNDSYAILSFAEQSRAYKRFPENLTQQSFVLLHL